MMRAPIRTRAPLSIIRPLRLVLWASAPDASRRPDVPRRWRIARKVAGMAVRPVRTMTELHQHWWIALTVRWSPDDSEQTRPGGAPQVAPAAAVRQLRGAHRVSRASVRRVLRPSWAWPAPVATRQPGLRAAQWAAADGVIAPEPPRQQGRAASLVMRRGMAASTWHLPPQALGILPQGDGAARRIGRHWIAQGAAAVTEWWETMFSETTTRLRLRAATQFRRERAAPHDGQGMAAPWSARRRLASLLLRPVGAVRSVLPGRAAEAPRMPPQPGSPSDAARAFAVASAPRVWRKAETAAPALAVAAPQRAAAPLVLRNESRATTGFSVPAPAQAQPDTGRLVDEVLRRLDRHARLERQRRGY